MKLKRRLAHDDGDGTAFDLSSWGFYTWVIRGKRRSILNECNLEQSVLVNKWIMQCKMGPETRFYHHHRNTNFY